MLLDEMNSLHVCNVFVLRWWNCCAHFQLCLLANLIQRNADLLKNFKRIINILEGKAYREKNALRTEWLMSIEQECTFVTTNSWLRSFTFEIQKEDWV